MRDGKEPGPNQKAKWGKDTGAYLAGGCWLCLSLRSQSVFSEALYFLAVAWMVAKEKMGADIQWD